MTGWGMELARKWKGGKAVVYLALPFSEYFV